MVCPRCGGRLTAYELSDAETVSCEDCSYIGVSVDHTSSGGERESWDEAIDRFYDQHGAESVDEAGTDAQAAVEDEQVEASKVKPTYTDPDEDGANPEATDPQPAATDEVETDGGG